MDIADEDPVVALLTCSIILTLGYKPLQHVFELLKTRFIAGEIVSQYLPTCNLFFRILIIIAMFHIT